MAGWRSATVGLMFFWLPSVSVAAPDASAPVLPLNILRVTPTGDDVPAGRQIVISFNRPVVPLGRMERKAEELPVTITPSVPCEWRWINTSALSCNLPEKGALAFSTRYSVEIKPGIRAEDGGTLAEPYKNEFITQRPAISWKQFHLWKSPGRPVIRLVFNQSVSRESVERHVFMQAQGAERHFFRLPTDARVPLSVLPDPDDRELPDFLPLPGEKYAAFIPAQPQKSDDDKRMAGGKEARRVWLVEPVSEIPLDTHVALKLEPGLVSALGPEPGAKDETVVEFDTFPQFAFIGVNCMSNASRPVAFMANGAQGRQQDNADQASSAAGHRKHRRADFTAHAIAVPADAGAAAEEKCDPLAPVELIFNTPVERGEAGKSLRFTPSVKGWRSAGNEDDDAGDEPEAAQSPAPNDYEHLSSLLKQSHEKGQTYQVWLPGGLKAAERYHIESRRVSMGYAARAWHWLTSLFGSSDPIEVEDMFARRLSEPVAISFATDHRKPNVLFEHHDAVLEKSVDSDVPLFVDNIARTLFNFRSVTAKGDAQDQAFTQTVPSVKDVQFAMPFGIRDALKGLTGAVYGNLESDPMTDAYPYQRRIFAEVTPWQVHLKLGHFNSIAWVADLSTGAPVEGARVTLYKDAFTTLSSPKEDAVAAVTDDSGVAALPGTETLDPDLSASKPYGEDSMPRLFLRVDKGDDVALLPLSSGFMINSYRASGSEYIYPSNKERYGHMHAWGLTAQGIYRAGDTIQYKIYVRNQDNNRFILPPLKGYSLRILDSMGKKVDEIRHVTLSEFGSYSGEYTIPKEAAVGWYSFRLTSYPDFEDPSDEDADDDADSDARETGRSHVHRRHGRKCCAESDAGNNAEPEAVTVAVAQQGGESWVPMRVLVSDFTPAPFKVTGQLNGDRFRAGQDVEAVTHAELHSGGPYTRASARVTAVLQSAPFVSKHPLAAEFQFDSYEHEQESQQVFQKIDMLNDKGELEQHFPLGKPGIVYGTLMVESAVQDDRGKYISGSAHADYIGVDRLVGLHATEWLYTVNKPANIEYIVVDDRGAPVAGTDVSVAIEHEVTRSARVKSAGNAYLTEYHSEWEAAGACKGVSASSAGTCSFTPKEAGNYRATATIKDTQGNPHTTVLSVYALGGDFVVWGDQGDTSLTLIPEKTDYKIGDTARYLIKNPYPGAKALVTIERYGILDRFVRTLDGSTPVIEFPIKPDYLPGFYLSVTVMSPRVDKPIEGQVDLGKPAFRMGYLTVPVKDPYKEMLVTANADRDIYKPRDKVSVTVHAEPRRKDTSEPIEIAVAVLDASVFDLVARGKDAFDPYKGFYKLENLDLRNYSLLLNLVGRQKFEKKGANPGGDGGHDAGMRSAFKFVSYWNPSITPDENGNATFTFDAPDNLTGWRILAMAVTPGDRFGLGEGDFKVNRPTEIRPVMPNQVTEGDSFNAGFSVMNRTDKARDIKVTIEAEGNVKNAAPLTEVVKLPPYQRSTVFMPVTTTAVAMQRDVPTGTVSFHVTAGDASDSDGLVHSLPVYKQRSLEVAANYATTTGPHAEEPVQFPPTMLPDVGSVSVVASPTVIGSVTGAFRYLRDYPYWCWEQQLTKGVMAAHFKELKPYLPETFTWKDSESLPQQTLDNAASFQAPNGGMAYFIAQDAYVDPYLSAYTALAFNWLRADGYKVPEAVESKLQDYLQNLLKNDAVPDFYSEGMSASVRAVALAALAEQDKITALDIERYMPHVDKMSLFGKAHFLQAALKVGANDKIIGDTVTKLLAASDQTGGKFVFSETLDDGYLRILASPLRDNCAILESLTRYAGTPKGKEQVSDIPFKLVRTITQSRKDRDHWENTQENMFCMNALIDYARVYENVAPNMTVTASMDDKQFGTATFKSVRDETVTLERPIEPADAGRKATVEIAKAGEGRLYYSTRLSYALPPEETHPVNAGLEIHREYSVERGGKWDLLKNPAAIKRGELVRVDLYVSIPAARNFVVVDDPVPGGLEPVNQQLATASTLDADKGSFTAAGGAWWFHYSDWLDYGTSRWSFYHEELRDSDARFYSDYLPAGNYHLSYTAQAIATGHFTVMPARAEEMYDPDVYGKTETMPLDVGEQ